jgi:hypothetical protein
MNKYAEYYSEYGLNQMIEDAKKKIEEKQKEYQEVCEGKRYNPACADWWKNDINEDIEYLKGQIEMCNEALIIKSNK